MKIYSIERAVGKLNAALISKNHDSACSCDLGKCANVVTVTRLTEVKQQRNDFEQMMI